MIHASEWVVTGLLRASLGLSIAALLVATCVRLLRLRAPRSEQWAWLFVLAQGVILIPVSVPVSPGLLRAGPPPQRGRTAPVSPVEPAPSPGEAGRERTIHGVGREPAPERAPAIVPQPVSPAAPPRRHTPSDRLFWSVVALTIWSAGIGAFVGLGFLRHRSFAGRLRAARPAAPEWQAEWQHILDEQAIRTSIPLVVSRDAGPALCLTWDGYRLVVPESLWAELAPAERASILRHELAHFWRGDLWTTLLARCLAVVQWFNPLAWWAASQFEAQSEFLCDQASAIDDPASFAKTLIRLGSGGRARIATVRSARTGSLFERVRRLLSDPPPQARWKGALPVAVAVLALGTSAVRLQTIAISDAAEQDPSDATNRAAGETPLPPRALLRIGTDNLRTRDFVTDIAFSPDGKFVAASEANSPVPNVELFDVRTGRQVKKLIPPDRPPGWVQCVAIAPDNTRLLWGEVGGYVALWDLVNDRMLFREKLHRNEVNDVLFSPDGTMLASAGDDGVVALRRVGNPGEVVRNLATGEDQPASRVYSGDPPTPSPVGPLCLAFTPDGTRLIVGSGSSATISIWRIKDGQLLRQIKNAHGNTREDSVNSSLNSVAVTPDGSRIMSSGQRTVPRTETKLKYGPTYVTLSEVRFWNLETGERVKDLHGEEDNGLGHAALSRDGTRVAVGDYGLLRILDAETGKSEQSISLPGTGSNEPTFSPDGTLVAMPISNTVGLFDVRTGRRLLHDERTPAGGVRSAAWSPSGDRIVTGHEDGEVRVWEAETGKLLWHHLLAPVIDQSGWKAGPAFVTFSRDGRRVVVAGRRDDPVEYRDGILAIYEATKGLVVRRIYLDEIRDAALSPDRRIVVAATSHGSIHDTQLHGIEVETGRTLYSTPPSARQGGFWGSEAMQFLPNSPLLDVAMGDGEVIRFDSLTGHERRRFLADWRSLEQRQANRPKIPQLWEGVFTADGRTLVSSSAESVYVWDVETGKLRRTIRHPHAHGCYLGVAPDGKTLATSDLQYAGDYGEDTIRLFDLDTGAQVLALEPGDNRAGVLRFSPDGTRLFTGFHRGAAMVWDVRQGGQAPAASK